MRTEAEIIGRIGLLTKRIAHHQEQIYDMALRQQMRGAIWATASHAKRMRADYDELLTLEWVLGRERPWEAET